MRQPATARRTAPAAPTATAGGQLLTVEQAAAYLNTGERFIRRLISERRLPFVKLGKYVRIERTALDAFIDAGHVASR